MPLFLADRLAVDAVALGAIRVQRQRMAVQRKALVTRNLALPRLDLGIEELLDASALEAHEVVVMLAFIQLEH